MSKLLPTPEILKTHNQTKEDSCIPMVVEYVLKEVGEVGHDFFDYQNDLTKHKVDKWISELKLKKVKFHLEKGLDIPTIFKRIEIELGEGRRVMMSYEYKPDRWHMYVVYGQQDDGQYQLVTSTPGLGHSVEEVKDLRQMLPTMKGIDLITYENLE
jgi:hypothetical protein